MPDGTFAPTTPVRAALDIEDESVAYLLTDGTYHAFDLDTRRFTGGGLRDALVPEASGVPLSTGETIPAGHAGGDPGLEGFVLGAESVAYLGHIVKATGEVVVETVVTEFGPEWSRALAPSRGEVRADWIDTTNDGGWATVAPSDFCDTPTSRVGPYQAFITPSAVHVYEAGVCFDFVERVPFPSFPPFARPGAPAAADVAAAFFHQGELHVFAN